MPIEFSKMLERVREAFGSGFTTVEIAKKLDITEQALYKWKNSSPPGTDTVIGISDLTGFSAHWLLTGEGPKRLCPQREDVDGFSIKADDIFSIYISEVDQRAIQSYFDLMSPYHATLEEEASMLVTAGIILHLSKEYQENLERRRAKHYSKVRNINEGRKAALNTVASPTFKANQNDAEREQSNTDVHKASGRRTTRRSKKS